ncbi:hypothetical protein KDA_27210 [Dictyobacter alpinus]|uniref:Uncharacterized protein n=1 Tax=Dictyobacter alpinus TaxID=2014873 RepID=A0A402B7D2_9CHLR|nr:hypothetical protein [Dictyobacter alpinus]GCE27237.1 hypothetical protein KDA_27210 [Dictyobacter alpinus]
MKVGSVGSQLYLVGMQQRRRTNKTTRRTKQSLSWVDQVARMARLVAEPWSTGVLPLVSEGYSLQIDELRERILLGTYVVDSVTLARCILRNETHFVRVHPE